MIILVMLLFDTLSMLYIYLFRYENIGDAIVGHPAHVINYLFRYQNIGDVIVGHPVYFINYLFRCQSIGDAIVGHPAYVICLFVQV